LFLLVCQFDSDCSSSSKAYRRAASLVRDDLNLFVCFLIK
jgi:hypothetical protein